ncbi:MAG: DUF5063 domain-containing protein [Coriobacteriia bacterium]|nr:DUF5063 domain-containing protein [Coriobacteriia bacterium]
MSLVDDYDWSAFRDLVRSYEKLLSGPEEVTWEVFARTLAGLLGQLYVAGYAIGCTCDYHVGSSGDDAFQDRDVAANPEYERWYRGWPPRAQALSDYIAERDQHFVPVDPSEPNTAGSRLSHDLSDVLVDLMAGSAHFDAGRLSDAMWEWGFRFYEWGDSAVSALKVIHWYVEWDLPWSDAETCA